MSRKADIERAKALAVEAITLCDQLGLDMPAAHLQLALDTLPQSVATSVCEERALSLIHI